MKCHHFRQGSANAHPPYSICFCRCEDPGPSTLAQQPCCTLNESIVPVDLLPVMPPAQLMPSKFPYTNPPQTLKSTCRNRCGTCWKALKDGGVTFDRKIKRSDLNVVISRSRLSTCPVLLKWFLFRLSYFIGSVQVNGPMQRYLLRTC